MPKTTPAISLDKKSSFSKNKYIIIKPGNMKSQNKDRLNLIIIENDSLLKIDLNKTISNKSTIDK